MKTTGQLARIASGLAFAVVTCSAAQAVILTAEQQCIDRYNRRLRLVSEKQGKAVRRCILRAGRGYLTDAEAETCITADGFGVARKKERVVKLYPPSNLAKCIGSEPIQQGATVGNDAHVQGPTDLAHDLFDTPLVAVSDPGTDERKCQERAMLRAVQLFSEKVERFWRCKTDGMRAGAVTNSATLQSVCMTPSIPDQHNQIALRTNRLLVQVTDKCLGLNLSTLFQGLDSACHASSAALANCVKAATDCRLCETLNTADGMSRDCDQFDDGLANGSCGQLLHKCVLDTTPATDSQLLLHIAALPVPLTFSISGALDIGAGGPVSNCAIQNIAPIVIPCIGIVCITPASGCPDGERHCGPGPGPPLGVDVQSDGIIGACATEAACDASCAAFCAPNAVLGGGCTGHCSGPSEQACTVDANCMPADGSCNGPDPVGANVNICQCTCVNTATHGPSDPGDLQCNLGANLQIESTLPCDGVGVTIDIGTVCIPFSTQRASALVTDANFNGCVGGPPCYVPPPPNVNDQLGTPLACSALDTSTTTGLVAVGAANFFDTALGDLSVGLKTTCQ